MTLAKIQSLQQTLKTDYDRPDPNRLEEYRSQLPNSTGWQYLTEERGLDAETIEHFQLGYDSNKDAIVIPHFKEGELINFKYRLINPTKARYLNEPNSEPWVFHDVGIEVANEKKAIAIAEGEFDAMSMWQHGFKNVISPGSGANSYGTWIELIDRIPQVWIAYDNDEPGQTAAKELAERIGQEKCRNVTYPDGCKDANDFFLSNDTEAMRSLFAKATPFHKYEFSGMGDVIQKILDDPMDYLEVSLMPGVFLERDNLVVVSGETNAGKSTYSLNVVKELGERGIPTLFLPIERGVYSLGRRLLQILLSKTQEDMRFTPKAEWIEALKTFANLPIYMAKPTVRELERTIIRAKRLFGVRMVIIDHMDYLIRGASNKEALISEKMHELKHIAEQNGIIVVVITHINRGAVQGGQRPTIKNLKGSSSLEQDSEIAIMLYPTDDLQGIEVDVQKNKGSMQKQIFGINVDTGVINGTYDPDNF